MNDVHPFFKTILAAVEKPGSAQMALTIIQTKALRIAILQRDIDQLVDAANSMIMRIRELEVECRRLSQLTEKTHDR